MRSIWDETGNHRTAWAVVKSETAYQVFIDVVIWIIAIFIARVTGMTVEIAVWWAFVELYIMGLHTFEWIAAISVEGRRASRNDPLLKRKRGWSKSKLLENIRAHSGLVLVPHYETARHICVSALRAACSDFIFFSFSLPLDNKDVPGKIWYPS